MAIINKIRERSGLAIGIIAVGLILFIVGGDLFQPNSWLMGGNIRYVGEISGERIKLEEFNSEMDYFKNSYSLSTGKAPDENELVGIRERAWEMLLYKKAFQKEFDKLGIKVTDREVFEMVQGNDSMMISPLVRQQFTNPQTGAFDKELVKQFIGSLGQRPPESAMLWKFFEESVAIYRARNKYENLLKISVYVTKAEAEKEYKNQNTKADVEYTYIPFTSMVDSTIQVTDEQLTAYLKENEAKYKDRAIATRTLDYIVFDVSPSSQDSIDFYQEIKGLAKSLATAENDSVFALTNSDANTVPYTFIPVNKLPVGFFNGSPTLLKNGIYGPFIEGRKNYKIFKVADTKTDSNYFARASHILIMPASKSDKDKAEAKTKAEKLLKEILAGASFEKYAKEYNTDATKEVGGDLGFFGRGAMLKSFEDAVFSIENEVKVLPQVVETDYGYHIVKVTHPKTNKLYKLAVVERILDPGKTTIDEAYRKAESLASSVKTTDEFKAEVAKNPSLIITKAEKLMPNMSNVNNISNAREVVKWAFDDKTKIGDVSAVFDLQDQNQYMIATLVSKTEKDVVDLQSFREDALLEVRKKIKEEEILKKLQESSGSLTEIAKKYGKDAIYGRTPDISMNANVFSSTGFSPIAIGKAFGMKEGEQSGAFADESGVFVVKLLKLTPASDIADFSQYKNQIIQNKVARNTYMISEAIREFAKVKDERYKFY